MLKKFLVSAAIASSLFAVANPASANVLTNWWIDTDGAGGNSAVQVQTYLDLNGRAYVNNYNFTATSFDFSEVGRFNTVLADSTTPLSPLLTSKFVGTGSGNLTNGTLGFDTGFLTVFSGALDIADFSLVAGSAVLVANSTLPNGTVSLVFKASGMQTGYFFDQYMNDLADIANSAEGILMGFATTNAISLATNADGTPKPNPPDVDAALITDFNAAFGTSLGTVTSNSSTDLLLSNNGQFQLEIPEPSMLSLLGLALVGVGFSTRRKSKV